MELLDPYLYPAGDDDDEEFEIDPELFAPLGRGGEQLASGLLGPPSKMVIAKRLISEIQEKLDALLKMVSSEGELGALDVERLVLSAPKKEEAGFIIEGVFDGEHMMGADGKQYLVPANYASKSKLVEGDILKLSVTPAGTFIYKQIGPIERQRVMGVLAQDEVTGDYLVIADSKKWSVLRASVTYLHAEPGDQMVLLVPKAAPSRWAAVENVVKKMEMPAVMSSAVKRRKTRPSP